MMKPPAHGRNGFGPIFIEGARFLGIMLGAALVLYFLLSPIELAVQGIEAGNVRGMLEVLGVSTRDAPQPNQFFVNEKQIEISSLCSGIVEMVLLIGAILATRHAGKRKQTMGIVIGVFLLYVFNLLRITISVLQLRYTSLEFAMFTHDILFRVILILGFALVYAGWVHFAHVKAWLVAKNMVGG